MTNIAYAAIQWTIMLLIRVPLILLGLVVIPVALLYRHTEIKSEDGQLHEFTHLPNWAWIWDNERDGATGDQAGRWHRMQMWGDSDTFMSMYWWLALRNPVNNMRFTSWLSCNTEEAAVKLLGGQYYVGDADDRSGFGWQFLKAEGKQFNYYCFRFVGCEWGDGRVLDVEFGHKIKVDHNMDYPKGGNNQKAWKGFTFVINPFLKFQE